MGDAYLELLFGIFFGVIGSAYILYGKRQYEPWYIVTGFLLIIYPYFVSNVFIVLLVGAALVLVPVAKQQEWL